MPFCSINQNIVDFFGVILKRRGQRKMVFLRQCFQHAPRKASFLRARLPSRNGKGSLVDGSRWIRDHQRFRELHPIAKAGALRTGAEWIIEGKAPRLDLVYTDSAIRAREALAEIPGMPVHCIDYEKSTGKFQHVFHRIRQSLFDSRPDNKAVHHNFNVMFQIFVEYDVLRQVILVSIYDHADIAGFSCLLQNLLMTSLPSSHHRRKQLDSGFLRQLHDLAHHLIHRLSADLTSAVRTVRNPDSCIQKPEIIIDLRDRSHCGSRVPVGRFLIDGNGGRQALDTLHLRFLHLPEELPRVGGETLHVTSLSLCINGVKRQRALSRSG